MSTEPVLLEFKGTTAWITLNRPEHLNALSFELTTALRAAIDAIGRSDARVIVITGAGRAFCAGGDLKGFKEAVVSGEHRLFTERLTEMMEALRRLERSPRPVIAAVNGVAVAGGLELILCCDIVIAADTAKIGDGHLNFGVIPGGGASVRLVKKLPANVARRLLLTGELMPAAQLAAHGLVNEVVAPEALIPTVTALADRIGRLSPLGVARVKQLATDAMDQPVEQGLRSELAAFEGYVHSRDFLEGLTAFEEKRAPRFTGR